MRTYSNEEINQRLDERIKKHNGKVLSRIIVPVNADYDIDEIGKTYNYLTVKRFLGRDSRSKMWVECECDCGRLTYVNLSDIKTNNTKSCGCLHVKHAIENGKKSATHGLSETRLDNIYRGIYKRCYLSSHKSYDSYGGVGIRMCDEWLHDKTKFFEWALLNGYNEGLTIDRINSYGNYCPENCRWTTPEVQGNNRKSNINITIGFSTYTISQWCKILNIPKTTVFPRIYKGWDPADALLTPIGNSIPNRINKIITIPDEYIELNKYKSSEL